MAPRKRKTDPLILEMPPRKMAMVYCKDTPERVFSELMLALHGSACTIKFDLKEKRLLTFKVSGLRAHYADVHLVPMGEGTHVFGFPVLEDTTSLPQKEAGIGVKLETWDYGTVFQILHLGSYYQEEPTVEQLHKFVEDGGCEIAGSHEEEYLTLQNTKVPKNIIRYRVKKK